MIGVGQTRDTHHDVRQPRDHGKVNTPVFLVRGQGDVLHCPCDLRCHAVHCSPDLRGHSSYCSRHLEKNSIHYFFFFILFIETHLYRVDYISSQAIFHMCLVLILLNKSK